MFATGACRSTSPTIDTARRHTTTPGCSRAGPRCVLGMLLSPVARIAILCIIRLCSWLSCQCGVWARSGRTVSNTHVYNRVVAEVLVAANDGVTLVVLEAHARAAGRRGVQAIEILDSGNNGLGGIVRVDLHSHGYPRPVLMRVLDELELDGPRDRGLLVLWLCELHDSWISTHGGKNMGFRGSGRLERM